MKRPILLISDQAGQATVEWTLLVVAFGLPMIYLFRQMLEALAGYYGFVTCIITLPFP
jgi:Flp pilus assembly pilin Flp